MITEPILVDDERVSKYFKHARDGDVYLCAKAVLWEDKTFLTLVKQTTKKDKTVSAISWCIQDEYLSNAKFYMNFIEMTDL